MTETVETIGKIHESELPRDAIHVAVLQLRHWSHGPALKPGTRITVYGAARDDGPGIVDPFLKEDVKNGELFWMFMDPGSITSLRHYWTHPKLNDAAPETTKDASSSEEWLRAFIKDWTYGDNENDSQATKDEWEETKYRRLIEEATEQIDEGEERYLSGYAWGYHRKGDDLDPAHEFWHHLSVVTGLNFTGGEQRRTHFTCSC